MAEMHTRTHTEGWQCRFPVKPPACLLRSSGSNFPLIYITFRTPTQYSWSHVSPMRCTWTRRLSSMPTTQITWHFRWRNTCVLFTLGSRCISCYATYANYATYQKSFGRYPTRVNKWITLNRIVRNSTLWSFTLCVNKWLFNWIQSDI